MTAAPAAFDPKAATIVVVTFNRSHLLTGLLTSITAMDPKPGRVVIIDNASSDDTTDVVESFRDGIGTEIVYRRLETNTGGSGSSAGCRLYRPAQSQPQSHRRHRPGPSAPLLRRKHAPLPSVAGRG